MAMTILDAINDKVVFGKYFQGTSWDSWRVYLAALFGLPLTPDQYETYRACTGIETPSPRSQPFNESWLIVGRRGGKSFVLATIATYLATFKDWRSFLGPGERGTIMIIAADRKQARVILRYITGLLKGVPMLAQLIEAERQEAIDLTCRVSIEVHTASFKTVRGYSICAALLDEIAFWPSDESASPDTEIINALRPAMATVPGSMMLAASSPYARRGAMWKAYQKYHGKGPTLVWQAPTRTMNPRVPQSFIDDAMEEDAAHASAEYGAQFRIDVESFVSIEAVQACVSEGVIERAPQPNTNYWAFTDPSGGSADSFTLAIGHMGDDDCAVVDCLREIKPPFSPESVVEEYSALLRSYNLTGVNGDKYAALWPREQFAKRGVEYWQNARPKSELYTALLPAINSRRVDLPDNPRLVSQLVGLERKTARGGRDSIDHAPNGHDDLANALAGLCDLILGTPEATVSLIPPVFIRAGVQVDDPTLPSWLRPDRQSKVDLNEEFPGRRLS